MTAAASLLAGRLPGATPTTGSFFQTLYFSIPQRGAAGRCAAPPPRPPAVPARGRLRSTGRAGEHLSFWATVARGHVQEDALQARPAPKRPCTKVCRPPHRSMLPRLRQHGKV